MKLFLILGNQLFSKNYIEEYKNTHTFFMAEDYSLCKHMKPSKSKILLFLSSMRSYADDLKRNDFQVDYRDAEHPQFKDDYVTKLDASLNDRQVTCVTMFEIEDKFFEEIIVDFFRKKNIEYHFLKSPMFINSREEFSEFLRNSKPQMATFYRKTRLAQDILIEGNGKPVGGKWSFDAENRKKIPNEVQIPQYPTFSITSHTAKVMEIIEREFSDHHGTMDKFNFATNHDQVSDLLDFFLESKLDNFGDYEDAVTQRDNILFHSTLSPYLNLGLITPHQIIERTINHCKENDVKLNSLEGFIRQVIGWREFMRGIYQNFSERMDKSNFFNHKRNMNDSWYKGETGLPPLDHAINNALNYGWSHHIERLMILSNLMNLCEIKPSDVYRWFMEMFVDSSDWVMTPNVYGMGLFSDGGIFATKPYLCGSNYILKMMDFKRGEWCEVMDGLYWRFINKNRDFFLTNPRLSLMVSSFDKMDSIRKERIVGMAENFIFEHTHED